VVWGAVFSKIWAGPTKLSWALTTPRADRMGNKGSFNYQVFK